MTGLLGGGYGRRRVWHYSVAPQGLPVRGTIWATEIPENLKTHPQYMNALCMSMDTHVFYPMTLTVYYLENKIYIKIKKIKIKQR